ncbi:MAG: MMPL family transporter [Bacteriovoracaceae bacterium]|jgi:predicted RND superfamily exporter protein|nr:MMPL family transporter [Bacteriovoracaceae bacterium]
MLDKFLKQMQLFLINFSTNHPKKIILIGALITIIFLGAFPKIVTDTDPVHMLPSDNPAVILHNQLKEEFNIADVVALGIQHKEGKTLFTPQILKRIDLITKDLIELKDEDGTEIFKVIDLMSVSTSDDIIKNDKGELLVTKLMNEVPKTQLQADSLLDRINQNPMLAGKLAAKDGSLIGIFMPINKGKKDRTYYLSQKIKEITNKYLTDQEQYYFAGLPVAESTFGNEMFIQMAVYAPMAGLVIFLLLLIFFRSIKVVIAPMILAMMAVIWSMGALIYSGNVIHIMSSMIPIFIMPIAVLDSVHILSVLSEKISKGHSRTQAVKDVILELFNPMFYTSLTTVVGFASLATTGIPPVVVFGITIAFGVAISFLLTIIFIPAYTMLVDQKALDKFGYVPSNKSTINLISKVFERLSWKKSKIIILVSVVVMILSGFGVRKIIINDNPVRWFKKGHALRVADVEMNKALAGTYMTNLVFSFSQTDESIKEEDDFAMEETVDLKTIKDPKVLQYMDKVSSFLLTVKKQDGTQMIGGTTSITDVLRKVGQVAFNKNELPKTRQEVSQYMFLFESGDIKKGRDMWKLIKPGESKKSQMWIHFKSGDNQNMDYIQDQLKQFMSQNPPPVIEGEVLHVQWAGLMKINSVWQAQMVSGMAEALIGSFIIVFLMMAFLFKSVKWATIAMLPLSLTILFIYGLIGYAGKFYDMPIAVLSSLTLGLSVDFAIHFIEHAKTYNEKYGSFSKTFKKLFDGTAQAIWRNVMVISIGFTPLFFAALQPYFTVGMFFFLIMLVSGVTTLLLIPSLIKEFEKLLPGFKK